ncbi:PDDEXK nuclease domain-containing protein [Adlercreutzia sp. R25]|uniref:PDDEXK nuclease domain-containing protein n=1 Tax=Adlercreutzia shanghongiae TaxID=3111773 RepID=UPI002DB890A9|nr:PDDEXK nuclease domain-containing protein [Adlercreutzia sp. R25]MEC4271693.1 PDDEXK nuclease domain-containing protein [Adlercreutzia sp. R25]
MVSEEENDGLLDAERHQAPSAQSYEQWLSELSQRYRSSQIKAAVAVNREMLSFYWSLGRDIVSLHAESVWGSGFYATLSRDLRSEIPNTKGFSEGNLRYMKRFYELFADDEKGSLARAASSRSDSVIPPQVGEELFSVPWGHIKLLVDRCKGDRKKAVFYVRETIANGWSRALLLNHLDSGLYERQGKAISNFERTLPAPQSRCAQEITRDPYQFDFLAIQKDYDERELKDALVDNISAFLLELGAGFAFMGREYRLKVGNTEQWIDLLFYNAKVHCYVVVEVKITEFEPAFIGQLGTYVTAVNHGLREEGDGPTVGLLICKTKDDVLAQYAVESSAQPVGVSDYHLSPLLKDDVRNTLPTIEEIETNLRRGIR